jgi:molybdate/tungstate transport system substrate-binding protein
MKRKPTGLWQRRIAALILAWGLAGGCRQSEQPTLLVFNAASLSAPMRPVLDTFARRRGVKVVEEHGASLELVRRITSLHRVPDVIALADNEMFPEHLVPGTASWYAIFARNRMVIAYTDRSRFAGEITTDNWYDVVQRPGVLFGRTDPVQAPAGYRALITFALAERFYHKPRLARDLEQAAPPSHIRGNAADLAALLETGDLDYIIEYESLARAHRFKFVTLPEAIDLGEASQESAYSAVKIAVASSRDTVVRTGAPILYAISVPKNAPHGSIGEDFVRFLLGKEGREMLKARFVDAVDHPEFRGNGVPAILTADRE